MSAEKKRKPGIRSLCAVKIIDHGEFQRRQIGNCGELLQRRREGHLATAVVIDGFRGLQKGANKPEETPIRITPPPLAGWPPPIGTSFVLLACHIDYAAHRIEEFDHPSIYTLRLFIALLLLSSRLPLLDLNVFNIGWNRLSCSRARPKVLA